MLQYKFETSIGSLYLVASNKGLAGLYWKKQKFPLLPDLNGRDTIHKILKDTILQVNEYLAGKRTKFDLPLDFQGTDFQSRVWRELLKVPFGKTLSYKELAAKVGSPKAVRAVGTANGRNPISLIIPCHRIIASDGKLAGYAGGVEIKRHLLALEGKLL